MSWWKRRPLEPNVLIQTFGWDPETQTDIQRSAVSASICLPISPTEGRWFSKLCHTPQELWDFLRALDADAEATLLREFNYSGPSGPKLLDIDDILRDIDI